MRQRRALVVRIWLDEDGRLQGQISDPLSNWKRPFHDPAELWHTLQTFLVSTPPNVKDDKTS